MKATTYVVAAMTLAAGVSGLSGGMVWAEDITLTTYYPSPRGVYNELRSGSVVDYNDAGFMLDMNLNSVLRDLALTQSLDVGTTLTVTGTSTHNTGIVVNGALADVN